ncbi:hypothetical protein L7F22_047933 [Adiantum nelumboides]|nr:hypothetical protein [Adiantum nelumboides]
MKQSSHESLRDRRTKLRSAKTRPKQPDLGLKSSTMARKEKGFLATPFGSDPRAPGPCESVPENVKEVVTRLHVDAKSDGKDPNAYVDALVDDLGGNVSLSQGGASGSMSTYASGNAHVSATGTSASKSNVGSSSKKRKGAQGSLASAFSLQARKQADQALRRFFYAEDIPEWKVRSPFFLEMVKAIGQVGPSYVPPTYNALRTTELNDEACSPPMTQILDRLRAFGEFEIFIFGDEVILEEPVDKWPPCDCLIAFYSTGFPMEKAEEYAQLRRPFLVNDLKMQHLLRDRRKVYAHLEEHGIPIPDYALVNRDSPFENIDYFIEEEDYIEVKGKRIFKPFVEKPVDGENHSIRIYYPSAAGGGMKELFRKVGNRSSEFQPQVRKVRRDSSYIYEEFMPTGGTDVKVRVSYCYEVLYPNDSCLLSWPSELGVMERKLIAKRLGLSPEISSLQVYTVGQEYAHAEARKSPVVDGVVMRSADGKEVRYPVLLTPTEKEMAREVCVAFGQAVCGFDLLRSQGRSYVCDVNGWSFVKNSYKYYDDAACVLRKLLLDAKAPHLSSTLPPCLPWIRTEPVKVEITRQSSSVMSGTFGQSEELRCVIAVLRHGDRTPKQKVKMKVTQERLLNLMLKYNGGRPRAEAKLKSAVQLQDLLDATRLLVPRARKPSTHGLVNGQNSNDQILRQTIPLPMSNAGCFEGGSVFQAMIRPSPALHGFMPDNAYGAMPPGSSNPMYGNIGVQPSFQCAAGSYGMPGANMRMAGFSLPDAQNLNMAGRPGVNFGLGMPLLNAPAYDNLMPKGKPKDYKEGGQAIKFDTFHGTHDKLKALFFLQQFDAAFAGGNFTEASKIRKAATFLKTNALQ